MINKKGQVYIFAAVVIAVLLFGLTITYNKLDQKKLSQDFKRVSDNYNLESARFLNALIEGDILPENRPQRFFEFTAEFSSYAKAKDPNYELFYVYTEGDNIYLGNFLDKLITIENPNIRLEGCYSKLKANIEFGGLSYSSEDINYNLIQNCIATENINPSITSITVCIQENNSPDNICYAFDITEGIPQVMIVTGETEYEQRQVYVGGKGFIKGEKK